MKHNENKKRLEEVQNIYRTLGLDSERLRYYYMGLYMYRPIEKNPEIILNAGNSSSKL